MKQTEGLNTQDNEYLNKKLVLNTIMVTTNMETTNKHLKMERKHMTNHEKQRSQSNSLCQ